MDLVLYLALIVVLAAPVAYAHALFVRAGPGFFGSLVHRGPAPWPHGVQEEDPESRWASRTSVPPRPRVAPPQEPTPAPPTARLDRIDGRIGPGSATRRH